MAKVALLGFGVVGGGAAEVLTENKNIIASHCGEEIEIKYILDLREFPGHPLENRVVHDIQVILNDPEVSVVAEMMGGAHPAYDFTKAALLAGKSVVTSNKEVVSTFGVELLQIAKEHGVSYLFEASVGGGIPIIRPMQNDLSSNEILSVSGILNGTTNFILTEMKEKGSDFSTVLKEAQRLGYAEKDPTADVEGIDAARKIAILAALAFGKLPNPKEVSAKGITEISNLYHQVAARFGCAVKLIAHTEKIGEKILAMVSPFMVPESNPISHVSGVFNGILVDANMLGKSFYYGAGAGKLPTASAVVADIIDVVKNGNRNRRLPAWVAANASDLAPVSEFSCRRVIAVEGCRNGSDRLLSAFGLKNAEFFDGSVFAVVTEKMKGVAFEKKLETAGVSPKFILPVLD